MPPASPRTVLRQPSCEDHHGAVTVAETLRGGLSRGGTEAVQRGFDPCEFVVLSLHDDFSEHGELQAQVFPQAVEIALRVGALLDQEADLFVAAEPHLGRFQGELGLRRRCRAVEDEQKPVGVHAFEEADPAEHEVSLPVEIALEGHEAVADGHAGIYGLRHARCG